jgi:hypothetical protein
MTMFDAVSVEHSGVNSRRSLCVGKGREGKVTVRCDEMRKD